MKCPKCNKKVKNIGKFCEHCGEEINKLIKREEKKVETGLGVISKKLKIPTYIWVPVLLLIILLVILIPTKAKNYTVEILYEDTEYYYEKEPFNAQEPYERQEAYQTTETYYDQVPIQKTKVNDAGEGKYYPSCSGSCQCTRYNWYGNCIQCTCQYTEYQSIAKERPVTKYKTVTDYREVTKYQDVQKSRQVMRTRNEQRTTHVNWIFKFEVPWSLDLG